MKGNYAKEKAVARNNDSIEACAIKSPTASATRKGGRIWSREVATNIRLTKFIRREFPADLSNLLERAY